MRPQINRVVELKIPSEEGYEKVARKAVATVAQRMDFSTEKIENIKTAISEACTNAMRYGSGGDSRLKIVVVLTADEEKLDILIKDPGVSGTPPSEIYKPNIDDMINGFDRRGGMGLWLISQLVDEAEFLESDDDDDGNQFRMVIYRIPDDEETTPASK